MLMKAAVYNGILNVLIEERNVPTPSSGEILIRVEACAICGTDVRIYYHGNDRLKPPIIIGHEVAASIAVVGDGVSQFKVGDRVVVGAGVVCGECHSCQTGNPNLCQNKQAFGYEFDGGFAEYMLIPAQAVKKGNLIRIPDNLSWEEASLAEPLSCVINGQKNLKLSPGKLAVIFGVGPIGLFHLQLAKMHGARVAIVDLSSERLALAAYLNPDFVVDASKTNPIDEIMRITNGDGADCTIICGSAKIILEQALKCTGKGGDVLIFAGMPKSDARIDLDANLVHYKEVTLLGSFASTLEQMKLALQYIANGTVNVQKMITKTLPLDQLLDGFEAVRNQQGLKIVIKP